MQIVEDAWLAACTPSVVTHQSVGLIDRQTSRPTTVLTAEYANPTATSMKHALQACLMPYGKDAEGMNCRHQGSEAARRCSCSIRQAMWLLLPQIKGESISNQGSHHTRQQCLLLRREQVLSHWPEGLIHHLQQTGQDFLHQQWSLYYHTVHLSVDSMHPLALSRWSTLQICKLAV